MNVLFVCTENLVRSRAAESLFQELQGQPVRHQTRSVGTANHAVRRLTTRDLAWADLVAVMEPAHRDLVLSHWPHHVRKIVVLGVSDHFLPDERELREILDAKLRGLLERCDGPSPGARSGGGARDGEAAPSST